MKAKKSYGQHFLAQPEVARQIADSVSLAGVAQVLEVGPGRGMLTQFLLARGLPLLAVEADRDMVAALHAAFPAWAPGGVTGADFLELYGIEAGTPGGVPQRCLSSSSREESS